MLVQTFIFDTFLAAVIKMTVILPVLTTTLLMLYSFVVVVVKIAIENTDFISHQTQQSKTRLLDI